MSFSGNGNLYVISAPSGTGKTTLVKTLVDSLPDITVSVSHTTRAMRPAEQHGVNYYFVSDAEFHRMIDHGDFLEHAKVFEHSYGTSRSWVEATLKQGKDVILEIDWQGAQQIKQLLPDCTTIFILPPSMQELYHRLTHRNQDKPDVIAKRLADAQETLSHITDFDYIVLNDDFKTALNDLKSIVLARRLKRDRQLKNLAGLVAEFLS